MAITPILMPALSPTMTEGKLAKWLKKEGDEITSGMVIAEIETDKATMEVEAVDEGILGKIFVAEGTENVAVNDPIAVVGEKGDDFNVEASSFSSTKISTGSSTDSSTSSVDKSASKVSAPVHNNSAPIPTNYTPNQANSGGLPQANTGRIIASPLARRIASFKGLDLRYISGSGPNGRIIMRDVDKPQPQQQIVQVAPEKPKGPDAKQLADMLGMPYETVENSGVRKVIASRLQESKQEVPHFYLTIEVELDNLLNTRKKINETAEGTAKASVNDFVIGAVAQSLKDVPEANSSWTDKEIIMYKDIDISIAVATDNGLITPIIKAADTKPLGTIATEMKDLAGRAREGKLKPTEFQGGGFSISNLGMFGIDTFQAIINPPQSCILAVGAGKPTPVVKDGEITISTVMKATLSVDHRSVDGAVGAQFLQAFKKHIEAPERWAK